MLCFKTNPKTARTNCTFCKEAWFCGVEYVCVGQVAMIVPVILMETQVCSQDLENQQKTLLVNKSSRILWLVCFFKDGLEDAAMDLVWHEILQCVWELWHQKSISFLHSLHLYLFLNFILPFIHKQDCWLKGLERWLIPWYTWWE